MTRSLLLITLLILSFRLPAQYIYPLHPTDQSEILYRIPKRIAGIEYYSQIKDTTSYLDSFDRKGRLTVHQKFDQGGNLLYQEQYEYDPVKNLLVSETRKNYIRNNNTYTEKAFFYYDDNNRMTFIALTDSVGSTLSVCEVKTDIQGNAIEFIRTIGNKTYSWQRASYYYDKNSVVIEVYYEDGKRMSSDTMAIDRCKPETLRKYGDVLNGKSEVIKSYRIWLQELVAFDIAYKYDAAKNWVEKTIYKVPVNDQKEKIKTVDRYFRRKINYWEE